jgi:hypothetical protein
VTSHGSSKWANSIEGEPGKRVLLRGVRSLCHPFARSRWIALYNVDRSTPEQRAAWLGEVERKLARL